MLIYFLLDISGSMEGSKIGALNDSMVNIIVELQEKAKNNQITIEASVLSFSRSVTWMYDNPINIIDFEWKPLKANGMTSLGKACCELANKLESSNESPNDISIILISDGCPTDDYDEGIFMLAKSNKFINSTKYAVALGDDADMTSLTRFVNDSTNIYFENNADHLLDTLSYVVTQSISKKNVNSLDSNTDDDWS